MKRVGHSTHVVLKPTISAFDSAISARSWQTKSASRLTTRGLIFDATLDLLFALFCNGRWTDARAAALDALLLVEETQGDRAAGGILFMLAYLSADDGQWAHATHLLDRLRRFYDEMHDEKRLIELELIAAQIDFARGRFAAAQRQAEAGRGHRGGRWSSAGLRPPRFKSRQLG